MNTETDGSSITNAISKITIQIPSAWAYEDLLHREVNQYLLDHGQDTISRDFLSLELEIHDYQWFLDAYDRTYWQGIGVLDHREEETVAGVEELYPIKAVRPKANDHRDFWTEPNDHRGIWMGVNDHRTIEDLLWDDEYEDDSL